MAKIESTMREVDVASHGDRADQPWRRTLPTAAQAQSVVSPASSNLLYASCPQWSCSDHLEQCAASTLDNEGIGFVEIGRSLSLDDVGHVYG